MHSRAGVSQADRDAYVRRIAAEIGAACQTSRAGFRTVYFGGGSPAFCDLSLLGLRSETLDLASSCEFTVELHPLDVTEEKLVQLTDLGVNRISMGVQSFDDAVLADMGRGYSVADAIRAFALVKRHIDNAGIDLIVGYPGEKVMIGGHGREWRARLDRFREMGLRHCSVYALQNERGLEDVPDDDTVLDGIRSVAAHLREMGLARYEISNYAVPGFECRHNLAVWRGEDYVGVGEGACGRVGLMRTVGRKAGVATSLVTAEEDRKERTLFRLRTRDGLDASDFPEWRPILERHAREGLLTQEGATFRLTDRGTEVCDAILTDLI